MTTQIVAMEFLETANLEHNGKEYTLRLAQQKDDSTKYAYIVQNSATGKSAKYEFSEEDSQDFKFFRGETLFEFLPEQIKLDLENDII
jgi:hypothetical protein